MPPKRTRRPSPSSAGLSAGERLKRIKLTNNAAYSAWGWVETEVTQASDIRDEHLLATCGFSRRSSHPICPNKHLPDFSNTSAKQSPVHSHSTRPQKVESEVVDDVIVISDDEGSSCTPKLCKSNPYCLNYLGQDNWENAEDAYEGWMKVHSLGENPTVKSRDGNMPIGLKNLGATCYANAYLQVWFQDLPFRKGVYECHASCNAQRSFEESPIFQLQVTFAAMQTCALSSFNPVKLVESLKLRATEQQDAQEFSKLFMAHLDNEFKQQENSGLRSLVSDQFQGKQVYNTVCQNCLRHSERDSDFLEIEVNLENNATLEERLAALLEPETLSDDNKYLCQQCDSLQDAKRYTELRKLPPVLHFSLLRFVYDLTTMERKKSKQVILFPTLIDMDRFLGSEEIRKQRKKKPMKESQNLYELRGILLHKGTSAYHGHYEAQVFDVVHQGWYQFNDEVVTHIDSLVPDLDISKKGGKAAKDVKKKSQNGSSKGRPAKNRRRVDSDSDIEVVEDSSRSQQPSPPTEGPKYISSKDAYMLVYARVRDGNVPGTSGQADASSQPVVPTPPTKALEVVNNLNAEHVQNCDEFAKREAEEKERYNRKRDMVMDVYRSWNVTSRNEDQVIMSRQALETWLCRHIVKPKTPKATPAPAIDLTDTKEPRRDDAPVVPRLAITDIICEHRFLDPQKAGDMKVLRKASYTRIADEDGGPLGTEFSTTDVCRTCVEHIFKEKLYQVEHPRVVARFDEVAAVEEDGDGYFVSRPWLKDWRLAKPKMHLEGAPDPPPDAADFLNDVICEHGGLSTNTVTRRRISAQAYMILQELFSNWKPPSTSSELCAVCEAMLHLSKEDRREFRKLAEDEKARLKHMHENALNGNVSLLEDTPCAIVPTSFVRAWRQWTLRPGDIARPEVIDNAQFVCEHGLLAFDPNLGGDLDGSMSIIKRSDWDTLEELYSAKPLIAIERIDDKYTHELSVCSDCRLKRRTEFDMTEITVRVLRPTDPTPTPETYNETRFVPDKSSHPPVQATLLTYSKRVNMEGSRKSKRIRQGREYGKKHKITITKSMSVKDLKVMFGDELGIPVISQRLFYRGRELEDSAATMVSLGILSNDLLDLKEESEDVTIITDTEDNVPSNSKKTKRAEGQAFGGTLLGGSSFATAPPSSSPSTPAVIACPACTYENCATEVACVMCDTPLLNTY
ncbi:cysteine proteinase [Epithele typhae]|uniref:cysteine proteinase n=1 Tax=Epithele typhae TaxID=378194 RepID=UPI002007EFF9|nr:cysteine proteinase [Epithele typhae]KAH9946153.1 cysteine proteinase [Epithele typhae]